MNRLQWHSLSYCFVLSLYLQKWGATSMPVQAVKHLKGNIWYWTVGFGIAGATAAVIGWGTPAAFLFMITGILCVMADSHVDPLAVITEDALHPEGVEIDQPTAKDSTAV